MTLLHFWGCALIAYGPPFAMFTLTVAKDPILIIILISSAFFWLVSLLISSIFWAIVHQLKSTLILGVIFSVLFQEFFRYCFYLLLKKAEIGLQRVSEVGNLGPIHSLSKTSLSYVAGLGFGIISGAFSLVNVLADSIGPGTVGLNGDSSHFFLISAVTTHIFILLHTFWGIIFFKALDNNKHLHLLYVVLSHILVSCLTFVNKSQLYLASIIPSYILMIITAYFAFLSAGGSLTKLKTSLLRSI